MAFTLGISFIVITITTVTIIAASTTTITTTAAAAATTTTTTTTVTTIAATIATGVRIINQYLPFTYHHFTYLSIRQDLHFPIISVTIYNKIK